MPFSKPPIGVGERAPDFALRDQSGSLVALKDLIGNGPIVLFFYPKDDTTGCTKEACRFRDDYARFREAGAKILGISSDSEESHRHFAAKFSLPYQLLSDPGGKVRALYEASSLFGLIPRRATFTIDAAGVIRDVFRSDARFEQHVEKALNSLQALSR
ncbi:MAG TPA: peroxiredoxin [Bryobacteraceae bacterium]|nr:peroxiredoxin [Bryobacteraceae bacterium]